MQRHARQGGAAVAPAQKQADRAYLAGPDNDRFVCATRCKAFPIGSVSNSIHGVLQKACTRVRQQAAHEEQAWFAEATLQRLHSREGEACKLPALATSMLSGGLHCHVLAASHLVALQHVLQLPIAGIVD